MFLECDPLCTGSCTYTNGAVQCGACGTTGQPAAVTSSGTCTGM